MKTERCDIETGLKNLQWKLNDTKFLLKTELSLKTKNEYKIRDEKVTISWELS